jgi:heme-degrading monooxygenase HmoA
VIARVWAARATVANAPVYAEHLRDQVIPALRRLDGYRGTRLLQRKGGEEVEIVVTTWWDTRDAIRRFAGADIDNAVVDDEAAALLIEYEAHVQHYDLLLADDM